MKDIILYLLVLPILVCLASKITAQSNTLFIPENNAYQIPEDFAESEAVSLKPFTYFLPDTENKINPVDITQPKVNHQFQKNPILLHHLEMTNGTYWFRIKIIGNGSEQQEYALNYPSPYTRINVYELKNNALILWDQSGFDRDAGSTFSRLGNDNIRLRLKPGEEKTFYMQCKEAILPFTNSYHTISLAPYEKAYNRQLTVWWYVRIPMVILATLIVYHLILYINLKKRLYLFMVFLLFGLMINGPDTAIITYQWFSNLQHFGMSNLEFGVLVWAILFVSILLFVREVLDLPQQLPKWNTVIKVLIFLILFNFGFTFLNRAADLAGDLYPNYFIGLPLRVFLSALSGIICLIISIVRWRQGSKSALWFIIAMSIPIISVVINFAFIQTKVELLQVFDVHKTLTDNLSFGAIVFFLAISLSERIKDMDRERIDSQLNHQLALAESDRLREINAIKSRLYTNITHEFRTPLTVIQGVAEQIQQHDLEKAMIHRNSQQLLDLVNQILELSKSDAGLLKVNLIHDDIIGFLRYITESFHALADNQQVELNFYSEAEILEMDYDPEKVLRVLTNLISNAIKFTPENGKVLTAVKTILSSSSDHTLEIQVEDTGIGIPSNQITAIFDRFYQVDDSTTRKKDGTGIGLALAKELVELMDGKIAVESEVGKGSTFTIHLPIRHNLKYNRSENRDLLIHPHRTYSAPDSNHLTPVEEESEVDAQPTLLIVEDNQDVLHYLTSCLKNDFTIQYAYDGHQGIEKAIDWIPDIIISDIMMPEKDGFELCTTLKQDERTDHIPIILLTAKADLESKLEGLEYGADAYLIKPFNQKELNIRLHKLIELRKKLHQKYKRSLFNEEKEPGSEHPFLKKARQVVLDQMAKEGFDVVTLSKGLHFSRAQLYRKIKALTGKSTTQYINEIRLTEGRKLLKNPEKTISEIAYTVGYADPAYFTRLFTKYYGKSPSEVREYPEREA